jgi:DNA-binding transcriptional ArsR family regulator
MVKSVSQKRAESFFRSLANESLIRLLGGLVGHERTVEELSRPLGLKSEIVVRHLDRLAKLGLVTSRPETSGSVYQLEMDVLRGMCRDTFAAEPGPTFDAEMPVEDWERDVLRNFFVGERLKEIPASPKKRQAVLKWLSSRFENGIRYPESEVNGILQRHHPDCAALRRYLVDEGFLDRYGGMYWRTHRGGNGSAE